MAGSSVAPEGSVAAAGFEAAGGFEAAAGKALVHLDLPAWGDDVETSLARARTLIDAAMSRHRTDTSSRLVLEVRTEDDDSLRKAAVRLMGGSRRPVVCVLPAIGWDMVDFAAKLLGDLAARGEPVQILYAPDLLANADYLRLLDGLDEKAEVRVATFPWQELLISDERVGFIRSHLDPVGVGRQALVVRAPALLRPIRALFKATWDSAAPLAEHRRVRQHVQAATTQRILGLLSAGCKDAAAARELGLSIRTYRRHVAEIMRELGAESRFQAGARAARLGLLGVPPRLGLPPGPKG